MDKFIDLSYQRKKLLSLLENFGDEKDILDALSIVEEAHKGQERIEGQDYVIHPIRIANALIEELKIKNAKLIIAGILHDVVEDCNITLDDIKNTFGSKVAKFVKKLTRQKDESEEDKIKSKYKKFKELMKASEDVRLIKAVDWLDNIRSYKYRKDRGKRFFRHIREVQEMSIPLAKTVSPYIVAEMEKELKGIPDLKSSSNIQGQEKFIL